MQAMREMILALERNGHTYQRRVDLFQDRIVPTYGRLARLDHDGLHAARVDVDEYSKDDARDFVCGRRPSPASRSGTAAG